MEYYYAMQANRGELAPQDKMRYFGRDLTNLESEEDKQQRLAALEAEKEKARKRAERFGLVPKESGEDADKKRKRDARFNNPDPTAEDKKLKT